MSVYKREDRGGRKGNYYASYIDADGKRIRFNTGTTDKQTAEQILAKRKAEVAKRREGIIDADTERLVKHSREPISKHLDAYIAKMEAGGRSADHVKRTRKRIEEILEEAGFKMLHEINADAINEYAANLKRVDDTTDESKKKQKKEADKEEKLGRSHRTIASHLQAIKGFTAWLAGEGRRLPSDPLKLVKKPSPADDRRLVRRALTVDEWQSLQKYVPGAGECYSMSAVERLLVYETALQTGLRSGELRVLTRGRLHLKGKQKFVLIPSRTTKNKKDARQFITDDLAQRLDAHVARKLPGAAVFSLPHETNMAAMIRKDVEFARAAWIEEAKEDEKLQEERKKSAFLAGIDHEGERIDFHALRHTCGAWLALAGVHPKAIQSIMRHSTIVLTLDTYGHLFPSSEADAINKLARMIQGEQPEKVAESSAISSEEISQKQVGG